MVASMTLHDALDVAATGDVWLFRGRSAADRAIRLFTNSPVNHVGVVLAVDDLPPLIWHAELGASMPNVWTGERERGAQLHRPRSGSERLDEPVRPAALVPSDQHRGDIRHGGPCAVGGRRVQRPWLPEHVERWRRHWLAGRLRRQVSMNDIYCAELVAVTYERMGLLGSDRPPNWYDPGRFWSGDRLQLEGAELGPEVQVTDVPPVDDGWREG